VFLLVRTHDKRMVPLRLLLLLLAFVARILTRKLGHLESDCKVIVKRIATIEENLRQTLF
jgi:hypothetical protein